MIGTIRKHSGVLWGIIITATVISFVFWGAGPSRMTRGGGEYVSGDLGSIYGHKITLEAYRSAQAGFCLAYWRSSGEWPDKNPNLAGAELTREFYLRLMLIQKANDLGIYVSDDQVVAAANEMLRSLGRNGQPVPLSEFVKQLLQPKGFTAEDFENYIRQSLVLQQLQQAISLTGELITPQEAAAAYQRDHQEFSAQIVFFSASNYLSSVTVTPAAVAEFYTNYLAEYRLPDRVQVSYVAFDLTNFLAEAEQKLSKTNLNEQVEAVYRQYGASAFPDAKTPADAKAKIRSAMIRQQALNVARQQANEFANTVFNQEPARPENLAAVAKQKGLSVHVTAPFAAKFGPEEFTAPEGFTKAAFGLTAEEPFAGPIVGPTAVYVLAFASRLPSEIPPLGQIRERVTREYKLHEATLLAQHAGTNFVHTLTDMTADRGFASRCVAAGLQPQVLPPFSLSTQELPELGERADLDQFKHAVFTTPVGKTSGFEAISDGGFVVYVQSRLPIDQTTMNSDLPQYTAALRRERQSEAFGRWVNQEVSSQLRSLPAFREQAARGAAR
jgi:hypothetical protein